MRAKSLALAAVFSAIIAVLSPISIPLGPIPLTLQTLIIPLIASITIPRISFSAVLVYLMLGLLGLPIFAGWQGGLAPFLGPTGGYLVGMLIFPLVISFGMLKNQSIIWLTLLNFIAAGLQLFVGALWLAHVANMTLSAGLLAGFVAFVIPALIKVALVSLLVILIKRRLTLPLGLKI